MQTKSTWLTAVPFMKVCDELSMMMKVSLCFAQILCAMSLFSVPVWSSLPRPKDAAGMCLSEWPHPRLHYSLNCASLETTHELTLVQPETGNLSKEQTSMMTWLSPCCTHQLDCELRHRGREDIACSRAEPRGTLWLLEHESDSCCTACTNIAMCCLLLRVDFKPTVWLWSDQPQVSSDSINVPCSQMLSVAME